MWGDLYGQLLTTYYATCTYLCLISRLPVSMNSSIYISFCTWDLEFNMLNRLSALRHHQPSSFHWVSCILSEHRHGVLDSMDFVLLQCSSSDWRKSVCLLWTNKLQTPTQPCIPLLVVDWHFCWVQLVWQITKSEISTMKLTDCHTRNGTRKTRY